MTSIQNLSPSVVSAFEYCEYLAKSHYENFPVASIFLPKRVRPFVYAVYAFARIADDFADEGDIPSVKRLENLNEWGANLDRAFKGEAEHPVFIALAETASRNDIPKKLFAGLLTAFRMDVTTNRYENFNDLLNYCAHSANPVGRLVLYLFGGASDRTFLLSDHVCTALQMTNFWQDVSVDLAKGRIYLPLEDMGRFGYTESELSGLVVNDRFRDLMRFEVDRTTELFESGKPILVEAVRDLRRELALTWQGGMQILKKIRAANYNVLHGRPKITMFDKISILIGAFARRIS